MNAFDADCALAVELLAAWPAQPWAELVALLRDPRPLLVIGEGSSALVPGAFAVSLARSLGLPGKVEWCGGRAAAAFDLTRWNLVLSSNSGRTREVVELLPKLQGHERLVALLGTNGGTLERVHHHRVLLPHPEGAVAATASVVAQALTLGQAIAHVAGAPVPLAQIASAAAAVQALPLPVLADAASYRRVWWCGGESGASAELALKTMEIAGIAGIDARGSLVLHGIEEVFDAHDLVIALHPPASDIAAIRQRVGATPATLLVFGDGGWPVPEVGPWTPLIELVAGWRLLAQIAAAHGRDPAKPKRARKVGNPAE